MTSLSKNSGHPFARRAAPAARAPILFVLCLLAVEFLDELVDGVNRAAWPLVRADLNLSYTQVGVLLSVPGLVAAVVETCLGVLGDVWNRRALVLGGGVCFALALLMTGFSFSFAALLAATILFFPASGAFVNLSQAALMDAEPARREQNMARWTLSGSAANVAGPLVLASALALGAGWREVFVAMSALALAVLLFARRFPFPLPSREDGDEPARGFAEGMRGALGSLRRRDVLRWLLLLEVGDFTWDVMAGFLALYFVDVVGVSQSEAAFAVLVWMAVGLPGDLLLVPLLERVRGLSYLRVSTACVLLLFPAFLLAGGLTAKLVLLGLLGLANAGWYSILKAQLYAALPGRSGTVLALSNVAGLLNYLSPLLLGAFAERYGLQSMMWLLLVGPVVLLIGLLTAPRETL